MLLRWYDDPWDGTFWRRCECDAWAEPPHDYGPVTVRRITELANERATQPNTQDVGHGSPQARPKNLDRSER